MFILNFNLYNRHNFPITLNKQKFKNIQMQQDKITVTNHNKNIDDN